MRKTSGLFPRLAVAATFSALAVAAVAPAVADQRVLLEYDGVAYGVAPLGGATLDMALGDDGAYRAGATIASGGLAVLFDRTRLRATAEGEIRAEGLRWRRYELDHAYARKRRVVWMTKDEAAGVTSMITPMFSDQGHPPPSDDQKREARDPLSSLTAMAVAIGRGGACEGRYPTYDGKYRYDLALHPAGRDDYEGGGYEGPVLKCKLTYTPVAGYRTPKDMKRRIPEGEIWFALALTEGYAPPVRVAAPLPLGAAAIRLKSVRVVDVEVEEMAAAASAEAGQP